MQLISKTITKKIAALMTAAAIFPSAVFLPAKAEAFDLGGAIGGVIVAGVQAQQVGAQIDYF